MWTYNLLTKHWYSYLFALMLIQVEMPAFSVSTSDTSTGGAQLPHHEHRNRTIDEYFETASEEEHSAIIQDIAGSMDHPTFRILYFLTDFFRKGIDLGLYTTSTLVQDVRPYVTENAPLPQVATG